MIVLHPGFAKTATKTLQKGVFAAHPQINYLGLPARSPEIETAIHDIAKRDSITFDLERTRAAFSPLLDNTRPAITTVLSYENFTLYESRDRGLIAQRLKDIFGPARILFSLRRQEDLVAAWYLQKLPKYIWGKNVIPFPHWFRIKTSDIHRTILSDLDFNEVISAYERIFGRENVYMILFEQLRQDPESFAHELASVLDVDGAQVREALSAAHYNPTITKRRMDFARFVTGYVPRIAAEQTERLIPHRVQQQFLGFLRRGPAARIDIGPSAREWIKTHCSAGNRALNARYGNRLATYGYTL